MAINDQTDPPVIPPAAQGLTKVIQAVEPNLEVSPNAQAMKLRTATPQIGARPHGAVSNEADLSRNVRNGSKGDIRARANVI